LSADTCTNFTTPLKTLMAWVATQLATAAPPWGTNIKVLEDYNPDQVYRILSSMQPPACAVTYIGSDYKNQPRRTTRFAVFVACRNWWDKDAAQDTAQDLVEAVIARLDHEVCAVHGLCRVASDDYVPFQWSGTTSYLITFTVEDY
jgi:hypothetical protein